jgi:hypothetical protein
MAEQTDTQEMSLESFVAATTRSLEGAQQELLKGTNLRSTMMLSSAELEVKVAVRSDERGKTMVRPLSLADMTRGDIKAEMVSTLRFNLMGSVEERSPLYSEAPTADTDPDDDDDHHRVLKVPDLTGLTQREAAARLKAQGWRFVARAADKKLLAAHPKGSVGAILRQKPEAGHVVEADQVIEFWVNLGDLPVVAIDGIGDKMGTNLSKLGIRTVGELSLAEVSTLSSALRMNEKRTKDFVAMAQLVAHLTVEGSKDSAELITKGAGIRTLDELAKTDPEPLLAICKKAIETGSVRVPAAFKLTKEVVESWIQSAARQVSS